MPLFEIEKTVRSDSSAMTVYQVDVNPAILVWAREAIGLSRKDAARQLDMSELSLRYLEEGVGDVSMPRLRAMAKAYDRPLISFFLDEPETQLDTLPDFRQSSARDRPWSPELHKEYRRVAGQREIILDLVTTAELEPIPAIDLRLNANDNPELAAIRVRDWLNHPGSATNARPTLGEWTSMIEDKGALVTQVSGIKVSEMRGFSIGLHPLPVIALNGADSMSARSFSLLHELVHILLDDSALCDLSSLAKVNARGTRQHEGFCNAVAAAVLMPSDDLLRRGVVAQASQSTVWQFEALRALANEFEVSSEAMLLRLITLERAAADSYARLKPIFDNLGKADRKGFLQYYRGRIRNLGRRYIKTVLAAHEQGVITSATLTRYLDVKLKNLPRLIEQFEAG